MKKNLVDINKVFLILGAFILCVFIISYLFPIVGSGLDTNTNQSSISSSSNNILENNSSLNNSSNINDSSNVDHLNLNDTSSVDDSTHSGIVQSGKNKNNKAYMIDEIMEIQRLSYLFVYSNLEEKQLALSLDEYIKKSLTLIYSSYNVIDTNIIDISTKYVDVLMNELIIELKEDKLKNSFKFNNISSNDFLREKALLDRQEDMLEIKEKQLKYQLKLLIRSSGSVYNYSVFKNILDSIELD